MEGAKGKLGELGGLRARQFRRRAACAPSGQRGQNRLPWHGTTCTARINDDSQTGSGNVRAVAAPACDRNRTPGGCPLPFGADGRFALRTVRACGKVGDVVAFPPVRVCRSGLRRFSERS